MSAETRHATPTPRQKSSKSRSRTRLAEQYLHLAKDPEIIVRKAVLNNPNAHEICIGLVAMGRGEWKRNPKTGEEDWEPQHDARLRNRALSDPRCPELFLDFASKNDPKPELRALAAKRLAEMQQVEDNPALAALRETEASFGQGRFSSGEVSLPDEPAANSTAAAER